MKNYRIGFVGAGNMGRSLIGGLVADGLPAEHILACDPDADRLAELVRRYGVRTTDSATAVPASVDIVVLAVKPQVMRAVTLELANAPRAAAPVYLSIAAGVRTTDLARWLCGEPAIVRAMPNTPALVGSGATALFATAAVQEYQRELAENVLRAVGVVAWLDDEALMDAVTALSGSGPAYYFLVMEIMERAGVAMGLPASTARLLAIETAFGAAKMALESDTDPATLRAQVTSPGGTTERALTVLEQRDLKGVLSAALAAARDRSAELGRALGEA